MQLPLTKEEKLLCFILQDEVCASEAISKIDATYFDSKYRLLFQTVADYFTQYRTLPSEHILFEHIRDATADEERSQYEHALTLHKQYSESNKISDSDDFAFYLEENIKKKRQFILAKGIKTLNAHIVECKSSANPLNYDFIQQSFEDTVSGAKSLNASTTINNVSVTDHAKAAWEEYLYTSTHPDENKRIKVGIRDIDLVTSGGMPLGSMLLISGPTGSGKSIFSLNLAINAWMAGRGVAFFSLEMPKEQVYQRFYSRMSGLPINKIVGGLLTKGESEHYKNTLDTISTMTNNFHISEYSRNVSIKDIEVSFQKINQVSPIEVVVIDYITLMRSTNKKRGDDWAEIGTISQEVHEFAKTYNVVVITPSQVTRLRDYKRGDVFDQERVSRSAQLADNSDVIIQIGKPSTEKRADQFDFSVVKNRHGSTSYLLNIFKDLSKMYIGDELPISNNYDIPLDSVDSDVKTINNIVEEVITNDIEASDDTPPWDE